MIKMLQNDGGKWTLSVDETIGYYLEKGKIESTAYIAHQDKLHVDHVTKHNKNGNLTSYRKKHR